MPLPFDAVGQAVGAAAWLVGVVAERLLGDGVAAWAGRHGLHKEVSRLRSELRRANLVLGSARAGGNKIGNEHLAEPIAAVRRLAADARNLLDELDYHEIHEKIKYKEHNCSIPSSSKAQSVIQFAYGFANQTSKYISSAVKINAKVSAVYKDLDPSTTKRKLERHDIMTGMKKMKLADSDDRKMIPETMLGSDRVSDGTPEWQLDKDDISRRITNIVDQLHEICEDVRKALKQEKLDEITRATQSTSSHSREEGSCHVETKVFAREHERNEIEKLISNSAASNDKLSVLPIIGTGGVGKTTLARTVYNDPEIEAKFGIRIWIYVSANFDEVNLTREILDCISEGGHKNLTKNFSMLQDGIKKCLTKRFLLVLDDVWEDDKTRWNKLLAPLRCTEITGNVILVTTRNLSVAKMTSTMEQHINLGGLKEDEFWLFFKRCIFGDENYQGRRKLQKIGKEVVARLRGIPLAAKSVGTLLKRRLEDDYWQRISDGVEWKLLGGNDDILPALMVSYNHLPYHLQRLFSYCALFPKGYKFHKEQLVSIWIALGLVVDKRKRLEDTGSDYFDDLVDRSFFEKFESEEYAYYLMHDLIHDVAQNVSADECLGVDGSGPLTVSPSLTHVSIWTQSAYKKQQNGNIGRNENFEKGLTCIQKDDILRSLDSLMLVGAYDRTFSAMFAKTLGKLRYVRVLRLSAMPFSADILLSSVSKLIHLRYLELKCTIGTLKPLPEALCRLYHLQVLDVRDWSGLDGLPRGMCNLVNLRYLLVPESRPSHLHSKIARVGELQFLQELKEYQVQTENGFEISQLENLNDIRGSLRICNLENVQRRKNGRG